MLGCCGKVQSANGVIHLIVEQVVDLSADLKRIAGLDAALRVQSGRGDDAKRGGNGLDSREPKAAMIKPRDMYEPDLHIDTLRLKSRNFR
jgi:error-prone DNA polymerase